MTGTWYEKAMRLIDAEFQRLRTLHPDWTVNQILDEARKAVNKPKNGGIYPYRQWSKAVQDYSAVARKAYPNQGMREGVK